VLGDVARHYAYSDVIYLAIVGELPEQRAARLFHLALCSLATPSVAEAPTHVAVLSRACGGAIGSALAAALITSTEQARFLLAQHASLLEWFADTSRPLPAVATSSEADAIRVLVDAVAALEIDCPQLRPTMTRDAARLALLYAAGLRNSDQMEAAIVSASVAGIAAEALLASPRDLPLYPVTLPPFHYTDPTP